MGEHPFIVLRITNAGGETFETVAWHTTHPKLAMSTCLMYKDPAKAEEQVLDRVENDKVVVLIRRGNAAVMENIKKIGYSLKESA